jgi:hypothetical protein
VNASYKASWGSAHAALHFNDFANKYDDFVFDNPFRVTDSWDSGAYQAPSTASRNGAVFGKMALYPDNQTVTESAGATLKFGPRTRLTADVTLGQWTQDHDPFIPWTTNTSVPITLNGVSTGQLAYTAPLPAANLGGKADTTALNGFFTTQAGPIGIHARYRRYDFDNKTPRLRMDGYVRFDAVWEEIPRISVPYGYTSDYLDAYATWGSGPLGLEVGWKLNKMARTFRETEDTTENVFRVAADVRKDWIVFRGIASSAAATSTTTTPPPPRTRRSRAPAFPPTRPSCVGPTRRSATSPASADSWSSRRATARSAPSPRTSTRSSSTTRTRRVRGRRGLPRAGGLLPGRRAGSARDDPRQVRQLHARGELRGEREAQPVRVLHLGRRRHPAERPPERLDRELRDERRLHDEHREQGQHLRRRRGLHDRAGQVVRAPLARYQKIDGNNDVTLLPGFSTSIYGTNPALNSCTSPGGPARSPSSTTRSSPTSTLRSATASPSSGWRASASGSRTTRSTTRRPGTRSTTCRPRSSCRRTTATTSPGPGTST